MKSPFPKETYNRNATIYRILANATRLEILNILKLREAAVEDLVKILKLPKANVSQHLAILRNARLVRRRVANARVYYTIVDPRLVEPCRILRDIWKSSQW